jgi:ribosomal protein S18 acetylase RimI-like enzyme
VSAARPFEIVSFTVDEVDRVEALWKEMVEHHREIVGETWPVRDAEEAWQRRRAEYLQWVAGEGTMLAAVPAGDPAAEPLGYAMLLAEGVGATWDLGERVGEIESLSVAPDARGQGVGRALIEAAREHFAALGFEYWGVAVVEENAGATALYERAGFNPFYRHLRGRVDG